MQNGHERVTKALGVLTDGLYPFVERELKEVYKEKWIDVARESFRTIHGETIADDAAIRWDAHCLLAVTWDQWNQVFRRNLGHAERSLVSELRDFRNRWAHQSDFDFDDTYRVLDSVHRLLKAVSADEAKIVEQEKRDLMTAAVTERTNEILERAAVRREKWTEITIYGLCGLALVYAILSKLGWEAWLMALLVCILFAVLISKRLHSKPQIGIHECRQCGKIIYTPTCPYCQTLNSKFSLK